MKTYTLKRKSESTRAHEVTNAGLFSVYRWFGEAIVVINDDRMGDIIWRNRKEIGWTHVKYVEEFPDVHAFLEFVSLARMSDEQAIEVLSNFFTRLTTYKEATIAP